MSCGDVLVRRSCASSIVLKRLSERLPRDAWDIMEAWVEDVTTVMALVIRRRDGKHFLAIYDIPSDVLELRARG